MNNLMFKFKDGLVFTFENVIDNKKEGIIKQIIAIKADSYEEAAERFRKAQEFASGTNNGVIEDWMLWDGWGGHVGCEACGLSQKESNCWGKAYCHGYENGCGCKECIEEERRNLTNGA